MEIFWYHKINYIPNYQTHTKQIWTTLKKHQKDFDEKLSIINNMLYLCRSKNKPLKSYTTKVETEKTYSYEEAFEASRDYFKGDELAARVWVNKYALKDSYGNIYEKTPEDMHHRIAREIARIEQRYPNSMTEDQVFDLIKDFNHILPQGSPMAGIGNEYQVGSLSNCFVIGLDGAPDSYGGIIKIDEE